MKKDFNFPSNVQPVLLVSYQCQNLVLQNAEFDENSNLKPIAYFYCDGQLHFMKGCWFFFNVSLYQSAV